MNFETFKKSIADNKQPEGLSDALQALWIETNNSWNEAHAKVKHRDEADACWVHAYLHRVEGDLNNASYWYGMAGKEIPQISTREEWALIVKVLLKDKG